MTESIELNMNEVERLRRALEEQSQQTHRANQAEGRFEQERLARIAVEELAKRQRKAMQKELALIIGYAVFAGVMTAIAILYVSLPGGKVPTTFEAIAPVSLTIGAVDLTVRGPRRARTFQTWDWGYWGLGFLSFVQVAAEMAGAVKIPTGSA